MIRLRREQGLSQSRLYLTRWYSLGQRPPSFSEGFLKAARAGWQAGLDRPAHVSKEHPE